MSFANAKNWKFTILICAFGLVLLGFCLATKVSAQVAGATLTGSVSDPSGAAIPSATISVKNTATGVARTIKADSVGLYLMPNLIPGPYEVTASTKGFSTLVRSGITLAVGQTLQLNLTLQVGSVSQQVVVTGAAPLVQTATSVISAQVNGTTVRQLPLNGRDWTQLATLQPGIIAIRTQAATTSTANRGNRGFGNQLSDSGHRPYENNYRMDGISINDYSNGAPGSTLGLNLGVDAIQEFSVEATNYSAAYGRTSGAVINAITKSGTNSFHGDAYEFLRNDALDARNFFDKQIPPFRRNQFGVSAGGPIQKNKTFIFADYEGVRQNLGLTFHDTVPTAAARTGSLCSQPSLSSGTPCAPTTVSVDPKVAQFLQLYPLPNSGLSSTGQGNIGFFGASGAQNTTEDYVMTRVDHQISAKDSFAGSYFYDNAPQTFPDALLDSISGNTSGRQMVALEETHIASPTFVNTVRAGWSRTRGNVSTPVSATNPAAKEPSLGLVPGRFAPLVSVPGLTPFQGGFGALSDFNHHQNSAQLYDDAFWTRGTHSIKFGFAFERIQYNLVGENQPNGNFSFPSLQGFLLNEPTSVRFLDSAVVPVTEVGSRQSLWAGYVQDDWRARPNLTVNLGLRYELTTLPSEAHNGFAVLTNLYTSTPTPVKHLWASNATTRNFEPRVGVAYDPFHNGKTAIRGGFGIFDIDPLPWIYTIGTSEGLPFSLQVSQSPLPVGVFPSGAFSIVGTSLAASQTRYVEQDPKSSYAMNWNFNIQQQITPSTTFMVAYVGQHTIHDPSSIQDANMVLGAFTPAGWLWPSPVGSGTRLNPNVGQIRATFFDAESLYNALNVQLTKQMSRGLQFQIAYTYGKCIDTNSSGATDALQNSISSLIFFDGQATRGLCDYNIGQNLVANYVWNLPSPKLSSRFLSHVIGGWELDGIFTASTGSPFTPTIAGNPLGQNSTDPVDFPDRLTGGACNNPVNPGNPNDYIKLNCFIPPVLPTGVSAGSLPFACQPAASGIPNSCMNLLGNAQRNSLIGPGLVDFDAAIMKNEYFPSISETFHVQFRAEFFNILNRANFQEPNFDSGNAVVLNQNGTTVGAAGALVGTTTTSRQVQFGLKLIW